MRGQFPLWLDSHELAQTKFSGNTRMDVIQATNVSHMNLHPRCIMDVVALKNQGDTSNLVSVSLYKSKSPGCNECPNAKASSKFKACVPVEEIWTFSFSAFAPHVETLCRTVSIGGNVHVICILEKNIQYTCDYETTVGMPGPSDMRGLGEGVCNSRSGKLHLLKDFNPSTLLPSSQWSRTL